jgi:hypothetical protein
MVNGLFRVVALCYLGGFGGEAIESGKWKVESGEW